MTVVKPHVVQQVKSKGPRSVPLIVIAVPVRSPTRNGISSMLKSIVLPLNDGNGSGGIAIALVRDIP